MSGLTAHHAAWWKYQTVISPLNREQVPMYFLALQRLHHKLPTAKLLADADVSCSVLSSAGPSAMCG